MNAPSIQAAKRWKWRLVVLAILAAGVAGFAALQVLKPRPTVRLPASQPPFVQVVPVEFREGRVSVTGHGLVRPRAEVTLAAEISGRVEFVSPSLVTGGTFRRGEVLVRMDSEPYRAALAQASADRASAEAAFALAEKLLARTEELIEQQFLSRQTLDEQLATRDQARAALARAKAVQDQRRIDLEHTEIRAPFSGRVLTENIDAGDMVQPGKPLATIFADDVLEVAVSLTDRDMALVADPWGTTTNDPRRGRTAAATVTVQHGEGRYAWPARVDRVEAAVDQATRTFNVVVRVDNPRTRGEPLAGKDGAAPPLLVGMYATVAITGKDLGRHAIVPRRALRDGDRIWLLTATNTIEIAPVEVLYEEDGAVAVTVEAIPEGGRVIVSDLKVVTQGMAARAAEAQRGRAASIDVRSP